MGAYLFHFYLAASTDELKAVIPVHREHINKLFAEGRVVSYSVSEHRNMIWCVVNAEDEQEAMELVLAFPLYPYFTEVSCHPLLFHNTLQTSLPGISMN
jgi:hypothetical protein